MKRKQGIFFIIIMMLVLFAGTAFSQENLHIYGYFSTRLEKVFSEPSVQNGSIVKESAPAEWSYPFFNLMMQHQVANKFKVFINFNGAGASNVQLSNFWGEYTASTLFSVRFGKIYRKFGLYNEILDAVPTYLGIEPPELFDGDHLIVSRTTSFMLLGSAQAGTGKLNYSLSTDNGEGGPAKDMFPLGWDVNYIVNGGDLKVGLSGYTSGGKTSSDVSLGSGSPKSGVLPWMASDEFSVFGGYAEGHVSNFQLQGAFWTSAHDAVRDPASVVMVVNSAGVNDAQRARFLTNPTGAVTESNVNTVGDYDVKTFYARAGYSIYTMKGEFTPYFQWDYYENPETIKSKSWGGDNEAGLADDGKFKKGTIGIIFRPIPQVAVKLDGSAHFQKLNGENNSYPEIRFDISYIFGQ
ncbi:MAG: hypothetical protein H6696_01505 [Deferribacteres bacterium]|nr:hypothetical protein [candidate division KSB1 bacterium]MCB9500586.1 hypothetical protein [Deferribacteres bacterium]